MDKIKVAKNTSVHEFVEIDSQPLIDKINNKETFIYIVVGDVCPRCDALKAALQDYVSKKHPLLYTIHYFNHYQKISKDWLRKMGLPVIYAFPTIAFIKEGKLVEKIVMTEQNPMDVAKQIEDRIELVD